MHNAAPWRMLPAEGPPQPLYDSNAARVIEAAAQQQLPPHTLMERAGRALARLALAAAPHVRRVHVFAGPGNNGGDGLQAAPLLKAAGKAVRVTLLADPAALPADAALALEQAQDHGIAISSEWPDADELGDDSLLVDALLGLGARRAPQGRIAEAIALINRAATAGGLPVLAVDLPSGLHPDSGALLGEEAVRATHTLSLLVPKPGLFTALGRDHAGIVWQHDLEVAADTAHAVALLGGPPMPQPLRHAQHKGSFGNLVVIGGAPGMLGAARLAARAALGAGAGRVYLCPLDDAAPLADLMQPELMLRRRVWDDDRSLLQDATIVCGCGGGSAVRELLPVLLEAAPRLLLDADALNAIAADAALGQRLAARAARGAATVLTPHPLEAARLLEASVAAVQADRLRHASALAARFACTVVLKGSGSIIASAAEWPTINPSGNALLASAGTGDVLAGWIGGLWASGAAVGDKPAAAAAAAARDGVFLHGLAADVALAAGLSHPLLASSLIDLLRTLPR